MEERGDCCHRQPEERVVASGLVRLGIRACRRSEGIVVGLVCFTFRKDNAGGHRRGRGPEGKEEKEREKTRKLREETTSVSRSGGNGGLLFS